MSRRYGRNQKRKHLAEIAKLKIELDDSTKKYNILLRTNRNLQRNIDEFSRSIEELFNNSVLLPPETIKGGRKEIDYVKATIKQDIQCVSSGPIVLCRGFERFVNIPVLRFNIRYFRESLELYMHLIYEGHGSAVYAITEDAFRNMNEEKIMDNMLPLIKNVIPDLINHIRNDMK